MDIIPDHLTDITHDVCHTMLGLQVVPSSERPALPPDSITASINISGQSTARVEFVACPVAASSIAWAMYSYPEEHGISDDEIHDAIREIVNIVGGNIKCMLGGETDLSLPAVSPTPELATSDGSLTGTYHIGQGMVCVSYQGSEHVANGATITSEL